MILAGGLGRVRLSPRGAGRLGASGNSDPPICSQCCRQLPHTAAHIQRYGGFSAGFLLWLCDFINVAVRPLVAFQLQLSTTWLDLVPLLAPPTSDYYTLHQILHCIIGSDIWCTHCHHSRGFPVLQRSRESASHSTLRPPLFHLRDALEIHLHQSTHPQTGCRLRLPDLNKNVTL
jgi:hypothetical protein